MTIPADFVIEISNKLSALAERVESNNASIDEVKTSHAKTREDVFGNGKKGFVQRSIEESEAKLEARIRAIFADELDKREKEKRAKWDVRSWAVFVMVLGMVIQKIFFP